MSLPSYEKYTNEAMESRFVEEPEFAKLLVDIRRKLVDGYYTDWIVDAIFQRRMGDPTLLDAYAFSLVWTEIGVGDLSVTPITVGECPFADADLDENRRALRGLTSPFRAFPKNGTGRGAPTDGTLEWTDDIHVCQGGGEKGPIEVVLKPGAVPLEIGTTTASKTLFQVRQHAGLARWPYGREIVVLFNRLRPFKVLDMKDATKKLLH